MTAPAHPSSAIRWWERERSVDVALVVASAAVGATILALGGPDGASAPSGRAFALVAAGSTPLVWWRRHPLVVFVAVAALRLVLTVEADNEFALYPALAVAAFAVAEADDRRRALPVVIVVGLGSAVAVAAMDDETFVFEFAGECALTFLPIALTDAWRVRRERLRSTIDAEVETRVQSERLRIAHDLHDVVAHGLSTIAVQSGVASHLLDQDREQAREALDVINATGRRSLDELRSMLGVLRSEHDVPLQPTPADPDDLSRLVDEAAASGVPVAVESSGRFPAGASRGCVVAVHRIAQEALTNVARHAGSAPTVLRVEHADDGVRLEIVNEPAREAVAPVPSTGVGIVGMAERAASLGGELTAEPTPGGGFAVRATLPYTGVSS